MKWAPVIFTGAFYMKRSVEIALYKTIISLSSAARKTHEEKSITIVYVMYAVCLARVTSAIDGFLSSIACKDAPVIRELVVYILAEVT